MLNTAPYMSGNVVAGHSTKVFVLIVLFLCALSMCVHANDDIDSDMDDFAPFKKIDYSKHDPYEKFNRKVYGFNAALDKMLLKPIARLYQFITPEWLQERLDSGLRHLKSPIIILNCTLQLDKECTTRAIGRFVINSSIGVFGIFDVAATQKDHQYRYNGFADTLEVNNVKSGPYIVLPFFGPSSTRSLAGGAIDTIIDPFSHYATSGARIGRSAIEAIATREKYLKIDKILDASVDQYSTIRSLYFQRNIHNR